MCVCVCVKISNLNLLILHIGVRSCYLLKSIHEDVISCMKLICFTHTVHVIVSRERYILIRRSANACGPTAI